MQQETTTKGKALTYVISGLLLLLLAGPGILYAQEGFAAEMEEEVAIANVKKVRGPHTESPVKSVGVWYDTATILSYLRDTMPMVIRRMTADGSLNPPAGFKWVLGFYWMVTKDREHGHPVRRSFCVVPTLVEDRARTDTSAAPLKVIDYFNDPDSIYKHPPLPLSPGVLGFKGNPYDAGHLYP